MKAACPFAFTAVVFIGLCGNVATAADAPAAPTPPALRDGQHDFDFSIGTWKSHVRRLQKPLTGSTTWTEGDGPISVRKLWNGRADLEELEVTTPAGHLQGLAVRLYNPESHQWHLYWANSRDGIVNQPPAVGAFKDGRGEFYDQETYNGKIILLREIFSEITPDSYHFEQAFSADRGQTWEVNWIADIKRVGDAPLAQSMTAEDRNRDFDFNIGHWNVDVKRFTNPLSGNSQWTNWKGTAEIAPVWDGRANVAEFEIDGPSGHLEGLGLRLDNPETKQWTITWANSRENVFGVPIVGEFKDGRGDFMDLEDFGGRQIFVRTISRKSRRIRLTSSRRFRLTGRRGSPIG